MRQDPDRMISLFRVLEIIIIFSADQAQAGVWLYLPKQGVILPEATTGDGSEFSWGSLLRTPISHIFCPADSPLGWKPAAGEKGYSWPGFGYADLPPWAMSKVKNSQGGIIRSISGWPCTGGEGSGRVWSRPLWLYSLLE
jgi:hypothetical protein